MTDIDEKWDNYKYLWQHKEDIFNRPWYNDLIECVFRGENVENFIKEKDFKCEEASKKYGFELNASFKDTENKIIRDFVDENKEKIQKPPIMSYDDIRTSGLTEEYIDSVILFSKHPIENRQSIRRYYEGLNAPAAPRMGYSNILQEDMVSMLREKGLDAVSDTDERAKNPDVFVVTKNTVHAPFLDPRDALKANIIMIESVVDLKGRTGLSNPLLRESMVRACEKTKSSVQLRKDELTQDKFEKDKLNNFLQTAKDDWAKEHKTYSILSEIVNNLPPEAATKIKIETNNKYSQLLQNGEVWNSENAEKLAQDIIKNNETELTPLLCKKRQDEMIKEIYPKAENPLDLDRKSKDYILEHGYPESVFHAGMQGGNPYAVLCSTDGNHGGNMCFIYGATAVTQNMYKNLNGNGALGYAFGQSSHNSKKLKLGGYEVGFFYEYEARKDKQEMTAIDFAGDYNGGKFDISQIKDGPSDETVILPHQNKLKKIYIAMQALGKRDTRKIFPLELDENGLIKDEKWREFVELHNPIDDNLSGNMIEHRNNMIAEYDAKGKENMYWKINAVNNGLQQGYEPKAKESPANEPQAAEHTLSAANENTPELKETLKGQTEAVQQAKSNPAQKTPAANGDLHDTLKAQKEHSSIGNKVAAVSNSIDNAFEKAGKVLNDNAAGRMINKADSWRPHNKAAAKVMDKAGVVPAAAVVASGVSAYEQYKNGDKRGAAATFGKGVVHASVQGVATSAGMNAAAKGVSKTAEKVTEKAVAHQVAKTASKQVAKAAGKAAGKAVGKSVLKKIPLVSLGAGAYFAFERAKNGEWGKAGCELLSGAAGCVPGVGTAVSTGIDCGLAVADTKQAINETKKQQAAEQAKKEQAPQTQQKPVTAQRVAELRGIKPTQSPNKPANTNQRENTNNKPAEKGLLARLKDSLFSR